ncbi:hypothetical protein CTI12_AA575530 [Artemisia annua]|uniref:RNA-directed DNA polymerase, eukaryota, Reverse transcriptase zinc-binding domain protein n=1 Tax=Artemisia annua TaxID=35608 RepID=A0A2U1KQP2_ARTAN|nr:hypothetical protein CTI12_AA575530 [Artemisia annua]
MSNLKQLEEKIEVGSTSPEDREKRMKLMQEDDSLEKHEAMDTGVWVSDPQQIKEDFLNFYKDKFQPCDSLISFSSISVISGLSSQDRNLLEDAISLDEIKAAVWECGRDQALSHDGYSFAFVKKY